MNLFSLHCYVLFSIHTRKLVIIPLFFTPHWSWAHDKNGSVSASVASQLIGRHNGERCKTVTEFPILRQRRVFIVKAVLLRMIFSSWKCFLIFLRRAHVSLCSWEKKESGRARMIKATWENADLYCGWHVNYSPEMQDKLKFFWQFILVCDTIRIDLAATYWNRWNICP